MCVSTACVATGGYTHTLCVLGNVCGVIFWPHSTTLCALIEYFHFPVTVVCTMCVCVRVHACVRWCLCACVHACVSSGECVVYEVCHLLDISTIIVGVSIMWWVCHMSSISHTQNSGILSTSPFRTPGLSIHKTMTMTTGEFDYDTIFGNSEDDKDKLTEFAGLAYFLWIVFLIAMPILLVNLLVSEYLCIPGVAGYE